MPGTSVKAAAMNGRDLETDNQPVGNTLPDEILENIFIYLEGRDVIKCREVCKRWLEAVDYMRDSVWEIICNNESNDYLRGEYVVVKNRSTLRWGQVFEAVHSWSNVSKAGMTIHDIRYNVQRFKVISDTVVAALVNDRNRQCNWYSNIIIYYDLKTRRESHREQFDFVFSSRQFDENEHFYVFTQNDGTMVIFLKANRSEYTVGNLNKYGVLIESLEDVNFSGFSIIDKEVYFHGGRDEIIYVSTLVETGGVVGITTVAIDEFRENSISENVIGFTKKDGTLRILTDEGNLYSYALETRQLQLVQRVDPYMCLLIPVLKRNDFDWRRREIYNWLCPENSPLINVFFAQGRVVLGSKPFSSALYIYVTRCFNGISDLYRIVRYKAQKKIPLKNMIDSNNTFKSIQQLDLIETPIEHKIIVLIQNKLFVIEIGHGSNILRNFTHDDELSPAAKRARNGKGKKSQTKC